MRTHLDAFVRHLLADHHAPRTVKTYRAIFASFAAFRAGTTPPSRAEIEEFLARPRRDGKPRAATARNQELSALRSFAAFARRELNWATTPTEGIPFVREAPHDPAVLSAPELAQLFETAAATSRRGERARDLALLAVLSQVGLRVHEAVGLDVSQVDLTSATLVAVHGKGGTVHDLPLNAPAVALLAALLGDRRAEAQERALFVSQRGTRLSIRAAEALLARLRKRMGSAKHITPHTLRHTAATLTLTAGTDLSTVAELLRHSDVNTTRRYLHLVDTRRREAVRRLESTVPAAVLPIPSPRPTLAKSPTVGLAKSREGPVSSRHSDLDDQYGLVAQFHSKQETTRMSTRPSEGASVVEGDGPSPDPTATTKDVVSPGRISWPESRSSSHSSSSEPSPGVAGAQRRLPPRRMRLRRVTPSTSTCPPPPTALCQTTSASTCPPTRWLSWTRPPT